MNMLDEHNDLDDMERRLRVACRAVIPVLLDAAHASVSDAGGCRDATASELSLRPTHRRPRVSRSRHPGASVAALVLVIGLLGALIATALVRAGGPGARIDAPQASAPVFVPTAPGALDPTESARDVVQSVDVPWDSSTSPWDDVAVAPGTFGWYELEVESVAAELRDRLGSPNSWEPGYAARFLRCTSWQAGTGSVTDGTLTAADVLCDGLSGGYSEMVEFGDVLAIGSGTGPSVWSGGATPTIESLLWGLADGSLWGYETYSTPPEPTRHDVGEATAVSYRSGDHAYMVLEPVPGTFAWLHGRGLSDADLETLAVHLRPAELPPALPVPLVLGADIDQGAVGAAQLKLVWFEGRPCVGLQLFESCTPVDEGPALVRGALGSTGQHPSVAAVFPAGAGLELTVELFGLDEPQHLVREFVGVGISTEVYVPGSERLLAAHLTDRDGGVIATTVWGLDSMINGFAPDLIAEGRTDGEAWVVIRQDPAWTGATPSTSYGEGDYCWLLFEADGGSAPLCPPDHPPATAFGARADRHDDLDLIEVAADVTSLACGDIALEIIVDAQLDGRRFVVTPCDDPS